MPHNRPWRYLLQLYAKERKPRLLPKVLTLADMVKVWRAGTSDVPLHTANMLDRVALLHGCVQNLTEDDAALSARFARMDMALFLPWGLRLAALLEEMLGQGLETADLAYVENEVAAPAAALLGALGRIGRAYLAALNERRWTTPGLDQYMASRQASHIPPLLVPGAERPVLVAGFSVLSGTEDVLRSSAGRARISACILILPWPEMNQRTGPAPNTRLGCVALASQARASPPRWKRRTSHVCPFSPVMTAIHSFRPCVTRWKRIRRRTAACPPPPCCSQTAPCSCQCCTICRIGRQRIHGLSSDPLAPQPPGTSAGLQGRSEDGRYYWRTLLQCLRHPYLNMLRIEDESGRTLFLRDALRRLEALVRTGYRFVDPAALADECRAALPAPLDTLLSQCLAIAWPEDIAECLHGICDFLLAYGGDMWRHFPLDAEAMFRLMRHAAPILRETCLAQTPFPPAVLHGITRQVLEQERVPFEAEPLTGLQVLGMLETRLLHFERVLIVDATDDKLPGNPAQDPLLPDSLRQVLGLPDARRRERTAAHTLYRLCAGAEEVHFFWQEGINRSALFDGKKSRSRFVEQLIWEEEQRRGALLTPGEEPLAPL